MNNRMTDPNKLVIKDIEKFKNRTDNNVRRVIISSSFTGLLLAFTSVFGVLGLSSFARNEYIGRSLGFTALSLFSASGMTFSGLKTYKYLSRILSQTEIFSDMAKNQFEQKLMK